MRSYYRHGERIEQRRFRLDIAIAIVVLIIIVIVAIYLYFDSSQQAVINDEANRPQVASATVEAEFTTIDEETFRLKLPGKWVKAKPDHQSERGGADYEQLHYKVVDPAEEGRLLDVFVDKLPEDEDVSKLLPVSVDGSRIAPGEISGQCRDFTKHDKYGRLLKAKWGGHEFFCNTSRHQNTIGIALTDMNDGIELTGPTQGKHKYLIIYTDHGRRHANSLFQQILKDFEPL